MPMSDCAAQFAPFAALTGYDDAVKETGRLTDGKIEPEITFAYFKPDERKSFVTYAKHLDFLSVLGYNNIKSRFSKSGLDIDGGAFDVYRQRSGTEILK